MPKVEVPGMHYSFTDHRIRVKKLMYPIRTEPMGHRKDG